MFNNLTYKINHFVNNYFVYVVWLNENYLSMPVECEHNRLFDSEIFEDFQDFFVNQAEETESYDSYYHNENNMHFWMLVNEGKQGNEIER